MLTTCSGSCLFLVATILLWYEIAQSYPVVYADVKRPRANAAEEEKAESEVQAQRNSGEVRMTRALVPAEESNHSAQPSARPNDAQGRDADEESEKIEEEHAEQA